MKAPGLEPSFTPTQADVDAYRRVRAASLALSEQLVNAIPTEVLHEVGERLGIRGEGGVFRFPGEDAMGMLMDACIHGWPVDGRTVLESFRLRQDETGTPSLSDLEQRLLAAQSEACHCVFQIKKVVNETGVYAEDGFTGESFFLMDKLLSRSAEGEGHWIAAWLVTQGDWKMTTGAPAVLGPIPGQVVRTQLRRMLAEGDDPNETRRMAALAFTALGLTLMAEADPSPPSRAHPVGSLPKRPGRNQPCSCGSRTKYKYCCGR